MVRLDIEPVKGTSFHAEGKLCVLPGAALAAVTATPVRVSRTRRLIAEDMADMVFVVTADVPLHVTQNGHEQILDAGEAIFLRGSERSAIVASDRAKFINISVPIGDLRPMLAHRQDVSMTVVSRQSDALDLLLGYARLLQARQSPLPEQLGRTAAAHIRDLMAAMLVSDPDKYPLSHERGGVRSARLRAIKTDIGRHLGEPDLSIDAIAKRHRISPRYVRKLFQEEQTTFSDFVLCLRLQRSQQMLRSPEICTIASIAHAVGFNDLSYFNRTFRRRYGMTPSDFRSGAQ
jgi:AraC-like DNA-binding protein